MKYFLTTILFTCYSVVGISQTAPSNFNYTIDSAIAYFKQPQNSVCPYVNNGGAAATFKLINPPSGITINPNNGQIFWDSTVAVGHYLLTSLVTNSIGSTKTTFKLNVIPNSDDFIIPKYNTRSINCNYTNASKGTFSGVDVYYPTNDSNTQRPVFVFLHGGGFTTSDDKTQSYVVAVCTYMASCGFVAFAPNYNVGGGHTLMQNLAAVKDLDACLNSIRNGTISATNVTLPDYNPEFLFIGGAQSGAIVSCNFTFFDSSVNYNGYVVNLKNIISEADCWGSSPTTDRLYDFTKLRSNEIPTFIVHGSADQRIPVQESVDLDIALSSVGAYHDFWEINGVSSYTQPLLIQIFDSIANFQNRAWKHLYTKTLNPICKTSLGIISFNPSIGQTNTNITIHGTGFTGTISVSLGGTYAANYTVLNDSTITAIVGSGSSGSISITTNNGTTSLPGFIFCSQAISIDTFINSCTSVVYAGITYSLSSSFIDTIRNINGCDSIYLTVNITIGIPSISGGIYHPSKGYLIRDVSALMNGTTNNISVSTGSYTFGCLTNGANETIRLYKNNDINKTNGVTTLDLAYVQSHVLGKTKLNNPYKIIAADVNGDGKITTLDLVYMKRLILGIDTTFTNSTTKENRLWAFVDSSYQFPDTTNPFPFKDSISYIGLSVNKTNQTFIGVKLGDVNWDWNPALARMPSKVFIRPKMIRVIE